ncbi:MAG: DUF4179 domain-containing protein [Chloroflexota bacterium]
MTDIKSILHTVSDTANAEETNLWYGIRAELEEKNHMIMTQKKKKNHLKRRLSLGLVAALVGILILGSFAFGMTSRENYYRVTLEDIHAMSTLINASHERDNMTVTVDWAYADPNQIVLAYTVTDSDGNPISDDSTEDRDVELRIMWNNENSTGGYSGMLASSGNLRTHESLGIVGQQIVRYNVASHFDNLEDFSEGEINFSERTSLLLRANFELVNNDGLYQPFTVRFNVPYETVLFEQDNNVIDYEVLANQDMPAEDDLEVYFEHLLVTDSAVSTQICYRLPEDAPIAYYHTTDIALYIDNRLVETDMDDGQNDLVDINISFGYSGQDHFTRCGDVYWHIAFDSLPDEIRIELPSLSYSSRYVEGFDSLEQAQTFASLFAEQGHVLTLPNDEPYMLSVDAYPSEWYDLPPYEQMDILTTVWEQFHEIYPPEVTFEGEWSYTFDLSAE